MTGGRVGMIWTQRTWSGRLSWSRASVAPAHRLIEHSAARGRRPSGRRSFRALQSHCNPIVIRLAAALVV